MARIGRILLRLLWLKLLSEDKGWWRPRLWGSGGGVPSTGWADCEVDVVWLSERVKAVMVLPKEGLSRGGRVMMTMPVSWGGGSLLVSSAIASTCANLKLSHFNPSFELWGGRRGGRSEGWSLEDGEVKTTAFVFKVNRDESVVVEATATIILLIIYVWMKRVNNM